MSDDTPTPARTPMGKVVQELTAELEESCLLPDEPVDFDITAGELIMLLTEARVSRRLTNTLEFYANPNNHRHTSYMTDDGNGGGKRQTKPPRIQNDKGKRAVKALDDANEFREERNPVEEAD